MTYMRMDCYVWREVEQVGIEAQAGDDTDMGEPD
jgi:hypothetical protein